MSPKDARALLEHSLVTHELYMKKFNEIPVQKTDSELLLGPCTGENITLVGMLKANVEYKGQQLLLLDLYVAKVDGKGLALQDMLGLVCHAITECFTSCTNCQRESANHARQILDVFEDKLETSNQLKQS